MKLLKLAAVSASLYFLTGCVVHVNGDEAKRANVTLEENLSIEVDGADRFDIETGAGFLKVVGVEGQKTIEVKGDIKTTEEKNYEFTIEQRGSTIFLVAQHDSHRGSWFGSSPYIDVTVTMPAELVLDIDDGSGEISVSNINKDLKIDDGSGDIMITKIKGNLDIDDGSGGLVIKNITGNLTVDDGSGEIIVKHVSGDVEIEDGSGDLEVVNTGGKVTLDDGSGDILVETAGALEIIESGSGGLKIGGIKGKVDIDS